MVNAEVIRKRLEKLDEYLAILKKLQSYSFEEFCKEPEHYGSVERFLQLALEVLIDLGNHVIAEFALGTVNWQSDIPEILWKTGYMTEQLKETWIQMIGFRNILVHEYLDIDRQIVYKVLHQHLADFEALKRIFIQFL